MPRTRQTATKPKASTAKPKAKATNGRRGNKGGRPRIQPATEMTLIPHAESNKQAQYARLALYNYARQNRMIRAADGDVNTVSNDVLERAGLELISGTLLKGNDGIAFITELTKGGGTYQVYENPKKNGLTRAYSMEVRPYILRLLIADYFGSRARKKSEDGEVEVAKKPATRRAKPKAEEVEVAEEETTEEETTEENGEEEEGSEGEESE